MFLKLLVSAIESTLFQGGGGLHFKWCQGEVAGVGNPYHCVGVPTTFGRHCSGDLKVVEISKVGEI